MLNSVLLGKKCLLATMKTQVSQCTVKRSLNSCSFVNPLKYINKLLHTEKRSRPAKTQSDQIIHCVLPGKTVRTGLHWSRIVKIDISSEGGHLIYLTPIIPCEGVCI